jgi:ribonuclease P protein component
MTRSADFTHTVKQGVRAAQSDLVVHGYRGATCPSDGAPLVGFIVAKSVGGAVDRHRVARKLRHSAHLIVRDLDPSDRVVIRALPGSREADSAQLRAELRTGVRRVRELLDRRS